MLFECVRWLFGARGPRSVQSLTSSSLRSVVPDEFHSEELSEFLMSILENTWCSDFIQIGFKSAVHSEQLWHYTEADFQSLHW